MKLKAIKNYIVNASILGFFSVLSLYAFEFAMTHFVVESIPLRAAINLGIAIDQRSQVEVIEEMRKKNSKIRVHPDINASYFLKDDGVHLENDQKILPLGGISHSKVVYCNEGGQYTVYDTDRYGFHNPDPIYETHKNNIQYMLLGDSFTNGACVSGSGDIGSLMRRSNEFQVANFGVGSNGPLVELATLIEYGPVVRPKIILWMYYEGNDLRGLKSEMNSKILKKYLEQPGSSNNLASKQHIIDKALEKFSDKAIKYYKTKPYKLFRIRTLIKSVLLKSKNTIPPNYRPEIDTFKKILQQAKNFAKSWNGSVHFVYLPSWVRYGSLPTTKNMSSRSDVLKMVRSLEIPVTDIHNHFTTLGDPLENFQFRVNSHYNEIGYSRVAAAIVKSTSN